MNQERRHSKLPALSRLPGSGLIALLLRELEASQWWSQAQLRTRQFKVLDQLVEHAWKRVPYYRERFRTAGYRPGMTLDEALWQSLPLLSREQLHDHGSEIDLGPGYQAHGRTSTRGSSGSTGHPVTTRHTALSDTWDLATRLRDDLWQARDFAGKRAIVRPKACENGAPLQEIPFWGSAQRLLYVTGPCLQIDSMQVDVDTQFDLLNIYRPAYLVSMPSNLKALATLSTEHGVTLEGLKGVRTIGEVVDPALRELARRAWGTPLVAYYSAQETGCLALQCPDYEQHYHVMAETSLLEVLNESNIPCQPGEVGKVIVTPLRAYAMPLIRYQINDYAEVGEACPCGRGLPVLRRILGRVRNMLVFPNGERRWPLLSLSDYTHAHLIRQMQVVQQSPTLIELRIVVKRPLHDAEVQELFDVQRRKLGYPFDMRIRYCERLERGAGGKFEDFLSEV